MKTIGFRGLAYFQTHPAGGNMAWFLYGADMAGWW